ncbi:MAG: trehalose-6-phosphate synthase [Candidatus Thorarchaeota archaeon]
MSYVEHKTTNKKPLVGEAALSNLVKDSLQDYQLVVVSNREPYIHRYLKDEIVAFQPAGGLVSAIDPLLKICDGTWVAWGSGEADPAVVDEKSRVRVPPAHPSYTLRRVWLSENLINNYYYGFSNRALWPLCHNVYIQPTFDEEDWTYYCHANDLFAKAAIEEIQNDKQNLVFANDYQLALVPQSLRQEQPDILMGHFWHIPWPPWEIFRALPWKAEIIESLLSLDLFGLQTQNDVFNFLRTVHKEFEDESSVDFERQKVFCDDHTLTVKAFPISIDYEYIAKYVQGDKLGSTVEGLKQEYGQNIILSVDRLDYTKGLRHRLKGINRFFAENPQYRGRAAFVMIVSPSRIQIDEYNTLEEELTRNIRVLNQRLGSDIWTPIVYLNQRYDQKDLFAFYRAADVVAVTSIQDGMNLVCKEAIAANAGDQIVLILSEFAGAADEVQTALTYNPFNLNRFVESIKQALEMTAQERMQRFHAMSDVVQYNNIFKWTLDIFETILKIGRDKKERFKVDLKQQKPRESSTLNNE